jgi:hypothetical protein
MREFPVIPKNPREAHPQPPPASPAPVPSRPATLSVLRPVPSRSPSRPAARSVPCPVPSRSPSRPAARSVLQPPRPARPLQPAKPCPATPSPPARAQPADPRPARRPAPGPAKDLGGFGLMGVFGASRCTKSSRKPGSSPEKLRQAPLYAIYGTDEISEAGPWSERDRPPRLPKKILEDPGSVEFLVHYNPPFPPLSPDLPRKSYGDSDS